ncbi:MAG TPA: head-tail connector protein [Mycobacteriales bacterium]|nr:head-tail connector protein [Mycobacteriales bacterium]
MSANVFYNASAEQATCSNVFSVSGTPADPTTATLVITDPAQIVTTYSWPSGANLLTRTGAGAFTQDVPCSSAVTGIWQGVWTGTGAASDVQPFTWTVWPLTLNQYYCSAEELKSRLRITGSTDDSEIALAVAVASRAVDGYCDRYFYRAADTRTYVPRDLYETRITDLVSVTSLATDPAGTAPQGAAFPVSWPAGSFQLLPYNPVHLGEQWPYTRIRAVGGLTFPWVIPLLLMRMDRVQVTGVFGWPQVPQAVRTASLITAAEIFRMKGVPSAGEVLGEHAIAIVGANPVAGTLLAPYQRHSFLAA